MYNPLIDGFSGFPIAASHRQHEATVEWLLQSVERHALAEQESLKQYEQLGSASGDPVIALVMQLILDDEERHHGLLKRIEASLHDAVNWTHSPDALPSAAASVPSRASDLGDTARALIEEERTGVRILRNLARREKDIDGGLHSLLIEMMAMDSEKHARLLEFVRDRLEANKG